MAMLAVLTSLLAVGARGDDHCRQLTTDFIVLEGEATLAALEDDIRADLEAVGINVTTRTLAKDAFNDAMVSGDFNMAFSETWGPPYDPHSYAASWTTPDEAHYAALQGLPAPMTQAVLGEKISEVLTIVDETARQQAWHEILGTLHAQAIDLPFSGKRIPAVLGRRLSGYTPGHQQFEYPVHNVQVLSGSKTITVAPGGQTGLFVGVGRLDPHSYRPNEFFSNNWVYEGLVDYGAGGQIQPSLATSWIVSDIVDGGERFIFTLRQGVKFHDGADWNCDAAKLNFDHVLAKPLTTGDWHGWYGLPGQIADWSCTGPYEFVVTTKDKYYPLLQEFSYIRPLRMLSPTMFHGGLSSDPLTQNSCPEGWGSASLDGETVTCAGTLGIAGTGRWKYVETKTSGEGEVTEVVFDRNVDHWVLAPGDVERMRLMVYESHAAVKAALEAGTLDLVVGSGVLDPADIAAMRAESNGDFEVILTEPIQNRIVILNSARAPTDDLLVRKTIMHAVNKAAIIDKELAGLAEPVDALFPKTAPYCDIDLTPRWDYDLEKAMLLNCAETTISSCHEHTTDFIVLEGEATLAALEDDIRADLEAVGINVTTRTLAKDAFNDAMVSGDFNMAFSETWGPPYDPHSYAASWTTPDEAHYAALQGLPAPMTQAVLGEKISEVLTIVDETARQQAWHEILGTLHAQAIDLPFSGKRIPAVLGRRLSGYTPGHQQFEYPVHNVQVLSGSKTITVAPGGQTGLFVGVGRLDPHSYRPNEFFSNNWVYEGLVDYGAGGRIQPSLATSWIVSDYEGGQKYTFTLRQGVKFHDGADWNCDAAKLNFDHVLAKPLTTGDWHGWYGLPGQITGWSCTGPYEFVVTTKDKYYPLLQEFSYIRPLRMLSPTMFHGGLSSDPLTQNSCPEGWGSASLDGETVTCAGTLGIAGTGRWKYVETKTSGEGEVTEVVFDRNVDHWALAPGDVERMRLMVYESHAAVKAALEAGTLDLVVGSGVLDPADIAAWHVTGDFKVILTEPIQNRIVILNSARAPTDDLLVRKTIMHAVNKAAIINKELAGLAEPVDALFPKTAPYCDADFTPRWDYDLEKAMLLNCAEGVSDVSPAPAPTPSDVSPTPAPTPAPASEQDASAASRRSPPAAAALLLLLGLAAAAPAAAAARA